MSKEINPERFCFMTDDDFHRYLIPVKDKEKFKKLCEEGHMDDWDHFNEVFGKFRINGISKYSFTDPKED